MTPAADDSPCYCGLLPEDESCANCREDDGQRRLKSSLIAL